VQECAYDTVIIV